MDEEVYDWLFQTIRPTGNWLDAGCGTGVRAISLAQRGAEVTAVDISQHALQTARKAVSKLPIRNKIQFRQSALEDLVEEIRCDNVHCRGVLMHTPDWRKALTNLVAYIGPHGYFVLFESNVSSFESVLVRLARLFVSTKTKASRTKDGIEYWDKTTDKPFLVRVFNHKSLIAEF